MKSGRYPGSYYRDQTKTICRGNICSKTFVDPKKVAPESVVIKDKATFGCPVNDWNGKSCDGNMILTKLIIKQKKNPVGDKMEDFKVDMKKQIKNKIEVDLSKPVRFKADDVALESIGIVSDPLPGHELKVTEDNPPFKVDMSQPIRNRIEVDLSRALSSGLGGGRDSTDEVRVNPKGDQLARYQIWFTNKRVEDHLRKKFLVQRDDDRQHLNVFEK